MTQKGELSALTADHATTNRCASAKTGIKSIAPVKRIMFAASFKPARSAVKNDCTRAGSLIFAISPPFLKQSFGIADDAAQQNMSDAL
jgi:hypothetical protein